MTKHIIHPIMAGVCALMLSALQPAAAQTLPSADPKMTIETEHGLEEFTSYSGSAPIKAHFTSNVSHLGDYTPLYEWHVYEAGHPDKPYLVRYDADMDYTFLKSGSSCITLSISFVLGRDTVVFEQSEPFTVQASESQMQVPNAFSPNGDGQNDIFKVKSGHKSIVKFRGCIFNRWGRKLFEWTDINSGWDGKYAGNDVADGVYFCNIEATGADGRKYHIKKAITLLRKYDENNYSTH